MVWYRNSRKARSAYDDVGKGRVSAIICEAERLCEATPLNFKGYHKLTSHATLRSVTHALHLNSELHTTCPQPCSGQHTTILPRHTVHRSITPSLSMCRQSRSCVHHHHPYHSNRKARRAADMAMRSNKANLRERAARICTQPLATS